MILILVDIFYVISPKTKTKMKTKKLESNYTIREAI